MTVQALTPVVKNLKAVKTSILNTPKNISLLKMGKDAYVNSRIDANLDKVIQLTKNSKRSQAIEKIVQKASEDFSVAKKQLKTAGIAAAAVAAVVVTAAAISKVVKNHKAKAAQNPEVQANEQQAVNAVA